MPAVKSVGRRLSQLGALLVVAACAGSPAPQPGPTPQPDRPPVFVPPEPPGPTPNLPPIPRAPAAPPALARLRGWMPLASTGVPGFLVAHPEWDGRGVLIAILDSGIDAGVSGLDSTSTGRPKLLDLRDFSGEGRVALAEVSPRGDAIEVSGKRLGGFGRVRGLAASGPWYAGLLYERRLGEPPASDLNENGLDSDSLVVVVARASDGWVLFADTDGDGSLANERPVHDYLLARETFGWHRSGGAAPLVMAAGFSEAANRPVLDLLFDSSGHGTHVAGIAAARGIARIPGFNGVAPGAQLLGLKISRNDFGGLTTTGSVLAALDYAIRFATVRQLPLVVNMSFGVGNEREGAARLDAMLDSVLALHPEVTFVTSAGNDGPGRSTIGFPGSMRRGITVGASQPTVFFTPPNRPPPPGIEPLLFFSSRGGELAKPDLVAPGTAYSTVPLWDLGEEFKSGTSMASPHVAGLAAILLSAARAERRTIYAEDVRRALVGSGRPLPGQSVLDAGAGLPEVAEAWRLLRDPAPAVQFAVELAAHPRLTAAYAIGDPDTLVRFRVRRSERSGSPSSPVELTFTSDVPWLTPPAPLRFEGGEQLVTLVQHPPAGQPGSYTGTVRARMAGLAQDAFRLVTTTVVPDARSAAPVRSVATLSSGLERHLVFKADSGRPFRVRTASSTAEETVIAALHQPGGAPIFGENGIPGGADTAAAIYDVDGRDARSGYYEAVAVALPGGPVTARIAVDHAPVGLRIAAGADSVVAGIRSLVDTAVTGRLRMGVLGGERSFEVHAAAVDEFVLPFELPAWATKLVVDLELDPGQWPRFTDFGLTALDAEGRILGKSPANYARTRLTAELPARPADQTARISLTPGFAEPGSTERWAGRVTVRLESSRPLALEAREGEEFRLGATAEAVFHAPLGALPWPLPEGFAPLGIFLVECGGMTWTWELPLGRSSVPRP